MNLPIFNLKISEETDDSGIFAISLVDQPATNMNYLLLDEDDKTLQTFSIANEDEQVIFGVFLTANTPIFRNNPEMGEHFVVFEKDTIKNAMQKFFKNKLNFNFNFQHNQNKKIEDAYVFESFQVDREKGINAPESLGDVPDGSWVGSVKIDDKDTWKMIKDGTFKGFSVEVFAEYEYSGNDVDKDIIDELSTIIKEIEELK